MLRWIVSSEFICWSCFTMKHKFLCDVFPFAFKLVLHRGVWKSESSKWTEQTFIYWWYEATHFSLMSVVGTYWYVIPSDDLSAIQPILRQLTIDHSGVFCVQSNYVQKNWRRKTRCTVRSYWSNLICFSPSPQLVSHLRKIQIAFSPDAIKISRSPW